MNLSSNLAQQIMQISRSVLASLIYVKICMNKSLFSSVFGFAWILAQFSNCAAEDKTSPLSGNFSVGLYTDYMFRGFNLYEGGSVQPSLTGNYDTGHGTLSGSIWMHTSGDDDSTSPKFFEMDDTLSYSMNFQPITVKIGHIWYTYPRDSDDLDNTAEFFGTIVLDDSELNPFLGLAPTLSVYHDYDLINGQYYELGFSHSFTCGSLGDGFNLTPFVSMAFASKEEEVYADNGLVQVTYGISSNLTLGDIAVVPSLNFTQEADDNTENEFWFGTSLAYNF